jgi:DNA-binding NarL/FixJ family response regulator
MDLDAKSLVALRRVVRAIDGADRPSMPHPEIVALAEHELPAGVTVDFKATSELGQPMIVLRVQEVATAALDGLTKREREIASLVAAGLGNKEIAARLGITLSTVKDHLHRILTKTGLSNRAAIAAAHQGRSFARDRE